MSYPLIVSRILDAKWAIRNADLNSILLTLGAHLGGEIVARDSGRNASEFSVSRYAGTQLIIPKPQVQNSQSADDLSPPLVPQSAAVADTVVIFGSGILGKHLSGMDMDCGGLSVDVLQSAIQAAIDDPAIKNVVLHLNTPGGVVTGIPETADLIASARETKKFVAYCDSLCASAGYWIASACEYICVTKSAEVGSIGVYSAFTDLTERCKMLGIKVELFKDGTYKAAGYPGTSLTDEQRADIQQGVDEISAAFKADVKQYRNCAAAAMQGQCFTGQSAVSARLADYVVPGLSTILAGLAALP